jgi:hypothetical protein
MNTNYCLEKMRGGYCIEVLGVDRRIILEWILGRQDRKMQTEFGSGQGPVVGSYEHGNEPLGTIKGGEFVD